MIFYSNPICFIIITNLVVCNAWNYWTSATNSKMLVVSIEHESDPVFPNSLNYTGFEEIFVQHPKINELTTEMQSSILNMKELTLWQGQISSVHLIAQLRSVYIENCSTTEVVINPNWNYQTDYLVIIFGKLEKLPAHLNVLKNLEKLYLHDNQIEFLDMADFNGLNKLKLISIYGNKLSEIRATLQNPVILPNLEEFYAYNNRLSDISFEHWNTKLLNRIWLRENKLQIALFFPSVFPVLREVTLNNNSFNCEWLTSTFKALKALSNVTIYSESETKCDKNGPSLEELVRRVKFKETLATVPHSENRQIEIEFSLKTLMYIESLNNTLTSSIDQLRVENRLLHNTYKTFEANMSELSASTMSMKENFDTEVRNEIVTINSELKLLAKSMQINKQLINSHESESSSSLVERGQEMMKLKQQIKLIEQTQNYQSEKQQFLDEKLAFDTAAEIEQIKQILEELQQQMNASSITLNGSVNSGSDKLECLLVVHVGNGAILLMILMKHLLND
ncbi:internalin I-like [Culex pipiens pallens]|uniref:internalin I-like n=1 Tax=Culex pipiens pallens TaxID=42434 RepID=UPI0022AAF2C8|nr:internalin I-like [Culex pipiens pallens]